MMQVLRGMVKYTSWFITITSERHWRYSSRKLLLGKELLILMLKWKYSDFAHNQANILKLHHQTLLDHSSFFIFS